MQGFFQQLLVHELIHGCIQKFGIRTENPHEIIFGATAKISPGLLLEFLRSVMVRFSQDFFLVFFIIPVGISEEIILDMLEMLRSFRNSSITGRYNLKEFQQ